jgi:putative transposase
LPHPRRRVVHFNVTEHPTAVCTAQQLVAAFPDDSAPSYLLRDREVYGEQFRHRVKGMRIEEVLTAPHRPWQNPFAERLIVRSGASVSTTFSSLANDTCAES